VAVTSTGNKRRTPGLPKCKKDMKLKILFQRNVMGLRKESYFVIVKSLRLTLKVLLRKCLLRKS